MIDRHHASTETKSLRLSRVEPRFGKACFRRFPSCPWRQLVSAPLLSSPNGYHYVWRAATCRSADCKLSGLALEMLLIHGPGDEVVMRKPIRQRIEELEQQKRTLQFRLDRQEKVEERRRTMLLGAFLMEQLHQRDDEDQSDGLIGRQDLRDWLARRLPSFIRRDADRALFGDLLNLKNTADDGRKDGGGR